MRKSVWLLSAGLFALSTPAFAQQTDTDQGAAQPTEGATAEAAAVDAAAVEPDTQTGDIVVTATRRNEALSDVPLAVSAVTAETLEYSGASDIRQLGQVSPSLLVSSTSSESGGGVARIRGIGTVGDNPGLESSVAVFIDGVYRSRTGVGLTELGALDRIEVLRGPQGTLFGRNASAGLISIITAKPKFTTSVYGELTLGNYDLRRVEAGATGAITESLAARIDGVYMKRDGFLEDVISGRDLNDRNRYMVRGQLLYQPSDDLSVRVIGDYAKRNEECCGAPFLPAHDTVNTGGVISFQPSTIATIERALGAVIRDDPFDRETSITPGRTYNSDVTDYGLSAEAVYDFGGAELTSISAYRYNEYIRGQDADFNNLDILYRDGSGGAFNRFKTFTQELRLQGEAFGGRLDWLLGGYYANEKLKVVDNLGYGADYERFGNCLVALNFASGIPGAAALLSPTSPTCMNTAVAGAIVTNPLIPAATRAGVALFAGLAPGLGGVGGFDALGLASGVGMNPLTGRIIDDTYDQTSNNWALFTHNIFDITDALKLTVGARYTHEKKKLEATLTDNNNFCRALSANPALSAFQTIPCVSPGVPGGSFSDSSTKSEGKVSGTVVLSWKPMEELLTYVSYSRGYKAGGFNLDRSALPRVEAGNPLAPAVGTVCGPQGAVPVAGCLNGAASLDDLQFEPETNDAVEIGMKYNGRGIDINVAGFHQLFDNFQLNTFNGINFQVENINSCSDGLNGADTDNNRFTGACDGKIKAGVRSMGVEFEVFTRPMANVSLNFGGVYAVTRYRHNIVGADGRALSNALFQLPGRQVSNSAEFTMTGSFAWTPPIGGSGMNGLLYVDGRHMSEFNTGSDLDLEKLQEGFNVVNARIGLHGPDKIWGVELWAQNVFDEDFMQVAFDAPLQGSGTERGTRRGAARGFYNRSTQLFGAFLGEPRTYGITVRGKF